MGVEAEAEADLPAVLNAKKTWQVGLILRIYGFHNSAPFSSYCTEDRGLILGRGFVPLPSSFAFKSLGLGVRELKIQSLGFGVRELKKL